MIKNLLELRERVPKRRFELPDWIQRLFCRFRNKLGALHRYQTQGLFDFLVVQPLAFESRLHKMVDRDRIVSRPPTGQC